MIILLIKILKFYIYFGKDCNYVQNEKYETRVMEDLNSEYFFIR